MSFKSFPRPHTILEAYPLLEAFESDPNIRLSSWEVPYNRSIILYDISVYIRGEDPLHLYLENPMYRLNIRIGNSVIQLVDYEKNPKATFFVRKGLRKFFSLERSFLLFNLKMIDQSQFNKLIHNDKLTYVKKDWIFKKSMKILEEEGEVHIFRSRKENGDNFQVGWVERCRAWIIASKNISILARNRSDIDLYLKDRFNFVKIVAEEWFDLIEKMGEGEEMKEFLSRHTLIGEFCGSAESEKIIKYPNNIILFFAIVNHDVDSECLPPAEAFEIFKKFNLNTVPIEKLGPYKSTSDFNEKLLSLYDQIYNSGIDEEHEGVVLYFTNNDDEVIRVCEVHSAEFKILNNLRQILKSFVKHQSTLNFDPIKIFKNDLEDLYHESDIKIKKPMEFYLLLANTCTKFFNDFPYEDNIRFINNKFASFLLIVLHSLENNEILDQKYVKQNLRNEKILTRKFSSFDLSKLCQSPISLISFKKQPKRLFVFVPICIPGFGKTFFAEVLRKCFKDKGEELMVLSSDKIRSDCMRKLSRKRSDLNQERLFELTGKDFNISYSHALSSLLTSLPSRSRHLLFLDKNHSPSSLHPCISALKSKCPSDLHLTLIAIFPDCIDKMDMLSDKILRDPGDKQMFNKTNNDSLKHKGGKEVFYPFSPSFFFECLFRVQNRKEHETLAGNRERSANVMIMYLQGFQNFEWNSKVREKFGFQGEIKVRLTHEYTNMEKKIAPVLEALESVLKKTEINKKCGDIEAVVRFVEAFDREKWDFGYLEAEKIKKEAVKCVEFVENFDKREEGELVREREKSPKREVGMKRRAENDVKEVYNEANISIISDLKSKYEESFSNNNSSNIVNLVGSIPKEDNHEKVEVPDFLGISIVDESKAKPEILSFIRASLSYLKEKYPEDEIIAKNLASLTKEFQFPRSLNISSFQMNNDHKKMDSHLYLSFPNSLAIPVPLFLILYVPSKILTGFFFPPRSLIQFENLFPFMTLMISEWGPNMNNIIVKELTENKLKKEFKNGEFEKMKDFAWKGELEVGGRKEMVYLIKYGGIMCLDGETKAWY